MTQSPRGSDSGAKIARTVVVINASRDVLLAAELRKPTVPLAAKHLIYRNQAAGLRRK